MNTTTSEVQRLQKIKDDLLKRIYQLRDELAANAERNISRKRRDPVENLTQLFDNPNGNDDYTVINKSSARLSEALQSVFGVQFLDLQKNWSHDNVYRYNSRVVTKAVQFVLELTVNVKDDGEDEIEDINCHFAETKQSYLQEITPWVQRFTKDKHFLHLISAFSDYRDQSLIRAKILGSMKSKGYVTLEECNEDGGGILIYVHPPKDKHIIFFKIQWYTKFIEKTWRVEHIFAIDPVQADDEFIRDHEALLQSFCRIGLEKDDLEEFWNKLCRAIDEH